MPDGPVVTVLMAVYNDRRFLPEAVESILLQSFRDFELLVIDDGSTDGCAEYLSTLHDPRVRVVRHPQNLGLTKSLNHGLGLAAGNFVARMDADDVAMHHRLERQVDFLRLHPGIGIVGSSRLIIDEKGAVLATAPALQDDVRIRWKCLLGNPFAHPAVMLRRDVLEPHGMRYEETCRTAQDYELWTRLLSVTRGANLAEPLLRYRLHDRSVGRVYKAEQLQNHDRIALAAIRRFVPGFEITAEGVTQLRGRFGGASVRDESMDPAEERWLKRFRDLLEAFVRAHAGDPDAATFHAEMKQALDRIRPTPRAA